MDIPNMPFAPGRVPDAATSNQNAPVGMRQTAQGYWMPIEKIHELDLLRDDLVVGAVAKARTMQAAMRGFKENVLQDIQAFLELAAEKYEIEYGGRKGNLSLLSFDGRYKLMIAVNETLVFDERLHIAKQLIDECIHEWTEDANGNIKALIEHAFQTDKQGNLNIGRIFGLMRLKIDDAKWTRAMEALKDSVQVAASKSYLRLYERVSDDGKYQQIALDIAGL